MTHFTPPLLDLQISVVFNTFFFSSNGFFFHNDHVKIHQEKNLKQCIFKNALIFLVLKYILSMLKLQFPSVPIDC